jgi:GAF domain-containing protein
MDHPPIGRGLIGALQVERRTIRIADITTDPRRVGFPLHHPEMRSFLGVPILAKSRTGDRLLGQIYLTDKVNYPEFTEDDERVMKRWLHMPQWRSLMPICMSDLLARTIR